MVMFRSNLIPETLEIRSLLASPTVAGVSPADGSVGIAVTVAVKVDVNLPNVGHGVSDESVKAPGNVTLSRVSDGAMVQVNVNTTGGGDAIILTPTAPLETNTKYRFMVSSNVQDTSGASFIPFVSVFTTSATAATVDSQIRFEKTPLPLSFGYQWTSVTVGPDKRLYAGTRTGQIVRFDLNPDGTFAGSRTIQTVRTGNGGSERIITGLAFDPSSTAAKPVLWISHGVNVLEAADNWTNKISKLTGANLQNYTDVVFNLPRSARDHLTNQMAFGPDGLLYVAQGSQSAQGAPDNQWGLRQETILSAAILQINTRAITTPLNVKTTDAGGSYNPRKKGNPVRLFATGVRNAYDLVWTRDGKLYAPVNGSASGGNAPAGGGAPALNNVPTQNDFLYQVVDGGYYGHPNPARGEFVLNGGNPTAATDPAEVRQYPVGTQPNSNYRGIAYDFGRNESPNGIIEFSSSDKVFDGKLNGKLLVAQYSGGDNIIVLTRDAAGRITRGEVGFAGLTQFVDPLDLVQHPRMGYLYVAEYGAQRITLLRPEQQKLLSGRRVRTDKSQLVFNDVKGGPASPTQTITLRNRGTRTLTVGGLSLTGTDRSLFSIVDAPTRPFDLGPGQYVSISLRFAASTSTTNGVKTAALRITSNDTAGDATLDIPLSGIATPGLENGNEPSLQRILDAWRLKLNAGDDNPDNAELPIDPITPNDEITVQSFVKAGSGNVTIQPIAVFAPDFAPFVADVGWYNAATGSRNTVFTVNRGSHQTVDPAYTGWNQFDPGSTRFGFYTLWPQRNNRVTYSQDSRNTWDTSAAAGRKMRVYPLKDAKGVTQPNAYVLALEAISSPTDHQDIVLIVRNVAPAAGSSSPQAVAGAAIPRGHAPTPNVFSQTPLELSELI